MSFFVLQCLEYFVFIFYSMIIERLWRLGKVSDEGKRYLLHLSSERGKRTVSGKLEGAPVTKGLSFLWSLGKSENSGSDRCLNRCEQSDLE